MSKVIKDGGQFFGIGVLALGDNGWVGVPPVYREPMKPHFSLLQVRLLQTGIKAVDFTPCLCKRTLQGPIVHTQPTTHTVHTRQSGISDVIILDIWYKLKYKENDTKQILYVIMFILRSDLQYLHFLVNVYPKCHSKSEITKVIE